MLKSRFILGLLLCLSIGTEGVEKEEEPAYPWRIHTLFSVECNNYFDWQTVGLIHSFKKAKQPGPITRLLSCTEEEKRSYRGMSLASTLEVPSMSRHPRTGDWYPAINKPAAVLHWLNHSTEAGNADWVVILDADMIIRSPIIPWEIGAKKGTPVAARYGYLVGCDNILAQLHTAHPELCDKVGGLLGMHIDDLRELAPWWLSKTEEVREDRDHWGTNITGDIYGQGWISEMYGYSFGAAEVGLKHKITDDLMIYPGYIPVKGTEPILLHYGLPFSVGNWSFSKMDHYEDDIVYDCGRLFPAPPYPRQVKEMENDEDNLRGIYLSIECVNTLNEALLVRHARNRCAKPGRSKYVSFLRSRFTRPSHPSFNDTSRAAGVGGSDEGYPRIHTLFSTECSTYFDWQTVGLMHSFRLSGQPGNITRLLSCTDEDLKRYTGHDLAPTHYVPSMSRHPLTGDWYPGINKPAAVLHWLNHANVDVEYVVVIDADMILRGPITPWEFGAMPGHPVSAPYDYLIGCDNVLAEIHTPNPDACEKVGGVIVMHVDDLRRLALLWVHKTEEVRADKAHYPRRFSGDIYDSGWISEMYGYAFAAAELGLRHVVRNDIMIYPGYAPLAGVAYRVFHYGLEFRVGEWSFDKARWRDADLVNQCGSRFPDPPRLSSFARDDSHRTVHELSIECVVTLNEALRLHHERRGCSRSPNLNRQSERSLRESVRDSRLARVSTHGALSSLTLWVIMACCVFSILGLCAIASFPPWSRDSVSRVRRYKHRRRASSLQERP